MAKQNKPTVPVDPMDPTEIAKRMRRLTDTEIRAQHREATARGKAAWKAGRCATAVHYDRATRRVVMDLSNGATYAFPVSAVRALDGMTDGQLSRVEVMPPTGGSGLRWDAEDIDLSVPGLLLAAIGPTLGMRVLGQKGGRTKSPAKAAASRTNGARGGRPRKTPKQSPHKHAA